MTKELEDKINNELEGHNLVLKHITTKDVNEDKFCDCIIINTLINQIVAVARIVVGEKNYFLHFTPVDMIPCEIARIINKIEKVIKE